MQLSNLLIVRCIGGRIFSLHLRYTQALSRPSVSKKYHTLRICIVGVYIECNKWCIIVFISYIIHKCIFKLRILKSKISRTNLQSKSMKNVLHEQFWYQLRNQYCARPCCSTPRCTWNPKIFLTFQANRGMVLSEELRFFTSCKFCKI